MNPSPSRPLECRDDLVALRDIGGRERGADSIALGFGESHQPRRAFGFGQDQQPGDAIAGGGQARSGHRPSTLLDALAVHSLRLAVVALDGNDVAEEHQRSSHATPIPKAR